MANPETPDLKAVMEAIAWANSQFSIAASAPRGSPERARAVEELRRASRRARELLDRYPGSVSKFTRVLLRVAELGLSRLTRST